LRELIGRLDLAGYLDGGDADSWQLDSPRRPLALFTQPWDQPEWLVDPEVTMGQLQGTHAPDTDQLDLYFRHRSHERLYCPTWPGRGRLPVPQVRTRPELAWVSSVISGDPVDPATSFALYVNKHAVFAPYCIWQQDHYYASREPVDRGVTVLDPITGTVLGSWERPMADIDGPVVMFRPYGSSAWDVRVGDFVPTPPRESGRQWNLDNGYQASLPADMRLRAQDSIVTATDAEGAQLWSYDLAAALPDRATAGMRIEKITPAPSRLYLVTVDGTVICLEG
jgi:hypothetical protein